MPYGFHSWQGCDSVDAAGQCVVEMTANRAVTASFGCSTTLDEACYDGCLSDCRLEGTPSGACIAGCRRECGGC